MTITEVDTIGAYAIFWYDEDDEGDYILIDEIWRSSFCIKRKFIFTLFWGFLVHTR